MGLTPEKHAELLAGLNPRTTTPNTPTNQVESTTIGNERTLRGIPVVGATTGAIIGTRPGIDTNITDLERAGHEILQGMLKRTRRNNYR